ncbi:predicted protein [Histoplasma mississippiense (nom. inval.)]|uniref:predicted protein n=1 Tax=Ajellomyces capsulatus (strain NAm1 / WU24) TaxID=2059318 RepID=UPI000157BAEB|nr:predicted protein [Histoplasma mississippiense (nom. inval.)]EDN04145.1 predicted protein [Histoplasma mississippiense (nom. inval.)]
MNANPKRVRTWYIYKPKSIAVLFECGEKTVVFRRFRCRICQKSWFKTVAHERVIRSKSSWVESSEKILRRRGIVKPVWTTRGKTKLDREGRLLNYMILEP